MTPERAFEEAARRFVTKTLREMNGHEPETTVVEQVTAKIVKALGESVRRAREALDEGVAR